MRVCSTSLGICHGGAGEGEGRKTDWQGLVFSLFAGQ